MTNFSASSNSRSFHLVIHLYSLSHLVLQFNNFIIDFLFNSQGVPLSVHQHRHHVVLYEGDGGRHHPL